MRVNTSFEMYTRLLHHTFRTSVQCRFQDLKEGENLAFGAYANNSSAAVGGRGAAPGATRTR